MNWTIYAALIAGFLAVGGAAALLVVRALQAWRSLKRLRRRLGKELHRLDELSGKAAENAARASDQAKLTASLDRLRVALAQLAVLRSALDEATGMFRRLTAVYPRK